jgi:hypothetical protein
MFSENVISSCAVCTKCWSNFKNLSRDELELVNRNRYEAGFNQGEIILKQGSPSSNAVFILSGLVKVYMEGYSGRNLILDLAGQSTLLAGRCSCYQDTVILVAAIPGTSLLYQLTSFAGSLRQPDLPWDLLKISVKRIQDASQGGKPDAEKDAWKTCRIIALFCRYTFSFRQFRDGIVTAGTRGDDQYGKRECRKNNGRA